MAKRKIKVPKVVNGMETMVEIEVDDNAGPDWGDRSQMRLLNHHIPRVDGPDKVTGAAKYTHDIRLPGMVYGRILPSPYPAAKITALTQARSRRCRASPPSSRTPTRRCAIRATPSPPSPPGRRNSPRMPSGPSGSLMTPCRMSWMPRRR